MILRPAPSNTRARIKRVRIRDEELKLPAYRGRVMCRLLVFDV
jgi:hypothetical protein